MLGLCVGCAQAAQPTASPPPNPIRSETKSDAEAADELIDAGRPPLKTYRYRLEPGARHEYSVVQHMRVMEQGVERGRVLLEAPLLVEVLGRHGSEFALQLDLGPVVERREGDTASIRWAGEASESGPRTARALVDLTEGGQVRRAELPLATDPAQSVRPLLETLLGLDAPPLAAVGSGARWRTIRSGPEGSTTKAEHELLNVVGDSATFRVQRLQVAEGRELRSLGEWTFAPEQWPPVGRDKGSFSLPEPSGLTIAASFEVRSQPK